MTHSKRPVLTDAQQALLQGVELRLLQPEERARFDQLLITEHYLKSAQLVGEQLRYVAEYQGQWVALFTWSAGAFRLRERETWIGWTAAQKKRRLPLVVNNSRFLILPDFHVPNLASRLMKLCLQRLPADWQATYGHGVLVAESFVDREEFLGTCYKASGWTLLGCTQGYRRSREDFYLPHERPKQLWVRELQPGARTKLRGRNAPAALGRLAQRHPPECPQAPDQLTSMCGFFAGLPDWRKQEGEFSLSSLVAVTVCALLCKACLGQRDLAAFAAELTPAQKQALGFPWERRRRRGQPHRRRAPGETTFFRLLSNLNSRALEKALLDWQNHVLGQRDRTDRRVALDGKELLNSQGAKSVSAYEVETGRWEGSEPVAAGSNEIPATQELLRRTDLEGALVTIDAMHTQTETGRIIVQECGADYLLTVKGNQAGVAQNVQKLYRSFRHGFSPSTPGGGPPDLRAQPEPV